MKTMAAVTAALSVLASITAITSTTAAQHCAITYETFEVAVPHIDLESCPGGKAEKGVFCRAATGGDRLHIFHFSGDGDLCLLRVESLDEDQFSLAVKSR